MLATYPTHQFQPVWSSDELHQHHHQYPYPSSCPHQLVPPSAWSNPAVAVHDSSTCSRVPRQHHSMTLASSSSSPWLPPQPAIDLHPASPASFPADVESSAVVDDGGPLPARWPTSDQDLLPLISHPDATVKTHRRHPSDSSIASAGPTSPFDPVASHPYILTADTPVADSPYYDDDLARHPPAEPAKSSPAPSPTSFPGAEVEYRDAWIRQAGESELPNQNRIVPKFQRTMTDAVEDELFQPSQYYPASTPAPPTQSHRRTSSDHSNLLSPYHAYFSDRMQATSQAHLLEGRASSPTSAWSRERSPFRQGSSFALSVHGLDARSPHGRIASLSHGHGSPAAVVDGAPLTTAPFDDDDDDDDDGEDDDVVLLPAQATISPKVSIFDVDDDAGSPLFPQLPITAITTTGAPPSSMSNPVMSSAPTISTFGFVHPPPPPPPPLPTPAAGLQIPQQYPFIPHPRREGSAVSFARSSSADIFPDFPAHLTSMESSVSEDDHESAREIGRPDDTSADTGTYTCTYHGCPLRFDTPAKLQKHKREGHRHGSSPHHHHHSTASSSPVAVDAAAAGAVVTAGHHGQAGPHRCDRTNPSTGRPCGTDFSRPYDLTRHEDTIHNARKVKARCQHCADEKTFSRRDALTRHMRVVHPEINFGARARRRALRSA